MDRTLKLSAEQKCDIAQREIEEYREEIEKLREDSEKVVDTYKVRTHKINVDLIVLLSWPHKVPNVNS